MKKLIAALLTCIFLSGCAQITVNPSPQPAQPPAQVQPGPQQPTPQGPSPTPAIPSKPIQPSHQVKQITVTLYYPQNFGNQGEYLVKVRQEVTVTDGAIVKAIISALQHGDPRYEKIIPAEAKLRRAWIKDSIVYLDFSPEFRTKHWGGTSGESNTIFAIVNSLTELPNINRVQFLLDGQVQESILGHLDSRAPFSRNENLIAK